MSIIEQHPSIELPSNEVSDSVQEIPFSWQAAEERARLQCLTRNCPTARDLAIANNAASVYDMAEETERLQQIERNQAAVQFLRELRAGDAEEQGAVLAYLIRVLDEDRYSPRKLFT